MIEEATDMVQTEMTAKIGRQVTGDQDRHHPQGIMIVIEAMTEVVATEEEVTEMAVEDLIDMSRQEIVAALTETTAETQTEDMDSLVMVTGEAMVGIGIDEKGDIGMIG